MNRLQIVLFFSSNRQAVSSEPEKLVIDITFAKSCCAEIVDRRYQKGLRINFGIDTQG